MKRNNDSHKRKNNLDVMGVGVNEIDFTAIEDATKSLRIPVSLSTLDEIPRCLLVKKKWTNSKGVKKQVQQAIVYAAAGPETVPKQKLKVMSDPLLPKIRTDLSETAISDPNLSPSINRRTDSLFEDGFYLTLEISNQIDPNTALEFTPEKKTELLQDHLKLFLPLLAKISSWKDKMNVLDCMRDSNAVSFVQGRNATMMLPGLLELQKNQLPIIVETVYADDLKEVIIDVGLTRKIVAVKTSLEGKKFLRADEMVYLVRGSKKALRRDGKFWGMPEMESILIISQILRRIYNYNSGQAVTASYIQKVLFKVMSENADSNLRKRVETMLADYAKNGTIAFATFDDVTVQPVENKVDWPMLNGVEDKLARMDLGVVGVPSSMMNREQNLNRDLATIQAIQFIKLVRGPDEKLIAKFFEDQMLTPLLAHLAGMTVDEMPVTVKIIRKKPEKDLDNLGDDPLAEKQKKELENPIISEKPIETSVFAAGGGGPDSIHVISDDKGGYIVSRTDS